ncbi:MAG: hypothetical protein ACFFG0_53770, partial [Candidatus Thorarchaeota archaeon]
MVLKGDFGGDASNWPVVEGLKGIQFEEKGSTGIPLHTNNASWDRAFYYLEGGEYDKSRKLEFYKQLAKILNELASKYGNRLELVVENSEVKGSSWNGTLVLRWKRGMEPAG